MKTTRLPDGTPIFCTQPLGARVLWDEVQAYFAPEDTFERDAVVFDVGANIGLFSLEAWRRGAGEIQLFSFEPIPATCAVLDANSRRFSLPAQEGRWRTLRAAIGQKTQFATFHHFVHVSGLSSSYLDKTRALALENLNRAVDKGDIGPLASFLPRPLKSQITSLLGRFLLQTRPVNAQVWTLSDAMRKLGVERIDCLKIDVEGAEIDVLRGVERDDWPKIARVILEIEDKTQIEPARAILTEAGFQIEERENPVFQGYDLKIFFASRN